MATQLIRIQRIAVALALALILTTLIVLYSEATPVGARPSKEVTTTYYSDATKTEEVGERTLLCWGGILRWGKVTIYSTRLEIPCEGNPTVQGSSE